MDSAAEGSPIGYGWEWEDTPSSGGQPSMAMFPCDVGNHRYRGAQQTMYAAVVHGQSSARRKLRLCDRHFDGFADHLQQSASPATEDLLERDDQKCGLCGTQVALADFMFFCTVYAQGQERVDWWAPLHEECCPGMMEDWHLEST
jgi:hypothetical protein